MASKLLVLAVAVCLGSAIGGPAPAGAAKPKDPSVKCERTIARASNTFFRSKLKLLHKCEKKKVRGRLDPDVDCLFDEHTAEQIDELYVDLSERVMKACGGDDRTCGTNDDVALADVGWGDVTKCPNFERGDCDWEIVDCDDVADCVACVGEAAADQAVDLFYGSLDSAHFGEGSDENGCQAAIGNATIKFMDKAGRELLGCWRDRLSGKRSGECPDEKTSEDIAEAEEKKIDVICRSCGGDDKTCGGGDDLSPEAVGFVDACPDVNPPSGGSCGGAIVDMEDLVTCVDCVGRFKVDCVDRIAVPGLADYPPECNAGAGPTTTTTISSTTTSTTVPVTCGNGVLDPGEECDPSSPGGAFLCGPGESCVGCLCVGTTTTTTPTPTSTTVPPNGLCGNGVLDPGEECDMSSPSGALLCPPGCNCDPVTCQCVPAGSTTTSSIPGSTSTSLPGSTTTTIVGGTTTTTIGNGTPTGTVLSFTTSPAGGVCGEARSGGSGGSVLAELSCGGLNIGGGGSTVPEGPTPAGATTFFNTSCSGSACTVSARTAAETGSGTNCSDTGCAFGPYLSIANGGLSTCVRNTFAAPGSGTIDTVTGAFDGGVPLTSTVTVTGNDANPCPSCVGGSCDGTAANAGASCTAVNAAGDTHDCEPSGAGLAPFGVDLTPIGTGTLSANGPSFCDGQDDSAPGLNGCFGNPSCDYIEERGAAPGTLTTGSAHAGRLASVFCIPATGNGLIDGAADLPGPGATTLPGTFELIP